MAAVIALFPANAAAARLVDGTPIRVRLLRVISSETSTPGEGLEFVVTRDVAVMGEVLIERGARVGGTVIDVQRLRLGFVRHAARLVFRFEEMAARDGQVIRLRASALPQANSRVVVDRDGRHHGLQWADGGDTFQAFVDGDYEVSTWRERPSRRGLSPDVPKDGRPRPLRPVRVAR